MLIVITHLGWVKNVKAMLSVLFVCVNIYACVCLDLHEWALGIKDLTFVKL